MELSANTTQKSPKPHKITQTAQITNHVNFLMKAHDSEQTAVSVVSVNVQPGSQYRSKQHHKPVGLAVVEESWG